jgi:arylsulfatase A-like enzyme
MRIERRDFLKMIGAGACLASTGRALGAKAPAAGKPNIVLCMADDQGWGDMAYNGHPVLKTPHFDAMAAESLRFDRFYAAAPVCSPTRGSVMTGRHPNRFGCFKWGYPVRPQETTLPEALKQAGYVSGHFGKWHLGSVRLGSGLTPGDNGFDEWLSAPNFYDNDAILSREGKAVQTMVAVDAALEFIGKRVKSGKPFLAVVWFGSPHGPHRAVEQDRAPYKDQPARSQHFFGEITGMDRAFGKLRKALGTLGIRENTILWYCSDNGGLRTQSSGGRGKKGQIYEGGLRVPAILEWPARITKPRRTSVPCVTSDIYPTLLELVGVRVEKQPPLDGISLAPLLAGRMKTRPSPIGFWQHSQGGRSTPSARLMAELLKAQQAGKKIDPHTFGKGAGKVTKQYPLDSFPGHAAWLDWPWKLHRKQGKGKAQFELYNLADDAMEAKDLAAGQADRVKAMSAALATWQKNVVRSLNGEDYG